MVRWLCVTLMELCTGSGGGVCWQPGMRPSFVTNRCVCEDEMKTRGRMSVCGPLLYLCLTSATL